MTDTERKYFLLGQAVRRSMGAAKTPVAYLYNGVRLPPLPEWDKTTYPYAVLTTSGSGVASLFVTSVPQYLTPNGELLELSFKEAGVGLSYGTTWGNPLRLNISPGIYLNYSNGTVGLWANYDVYTDDGTLYLAGSEPVPVYE